jgi:transcriptional regulator with XRE-family HTH domain
MPTRDEAWAKAGAKVAVTPNQVVAGNLRRARRLRGWTQEEAAARLEPYLGARWSKAVFSAAERSAAGERIREFTADEIAAFAKGFDVPLAFFFLPTDPDDPGDLGKPSLLPWRVGREILGPKAAAEVVLGTPAGMQEVQRRWTEVVRRAPSDLLPDLQQRWGEYVALNAIAAARDTLGNLGALATQVRTAADVLQHISEQSAAELRRRAEALLAPTAGAERQPATGRRGGRTR